jgi:hypothetical protein
METASVQTSGLHGQHACERRKNDSAKCVEPLEID